MFWGVMQSAGVVKYHMYLLAAIAEQWVNESSQQEGCIVGQSFVMAKWVSIDQKHTLYYGTVWRPVWWQAIGDDGWGTLTVPSFKSSEEVDLLSTELVSLTITKGKGVPH